MDKKVCKYSKCGKEFTPNHGKQLYCSANCKAYDFAKNKQVKKVVLVECEDGNYLFVEPDGTQKKCKLVWDIETGPVKVQTDIPVKKMDLLRGLEAPKKYDFGDAKFLIIENFTEYRMQDKPKNKFEAADWMKKKNAADAKIKEAWNNRHKV